MKNEGGREAGKYRTVANNVCLLFYLVIVFSLTHFRFLFVKPAVNRRLAMKIGEVRRTQSSYL
jgi:hypothetical protein